MELFKSIRQHVGKSILNKKLSRVKRVVRYSNLGKVKRIGIVWDASRTTEFPALSRFYQKMNERNIEVRILGYYSGKELPDQYTAIRYLYCMRRNELDFFYHPASPDVAAFIGNMHDILIDINFDGQLPLRCISSLSNAGFKVGLSDGNTDTPFDLMMEFKKPVEVEEYLKQVVYYLEMINSEKMKN